MAAVVEGFVDFRGYRTWYRVVGDLSSGAPPLLALHGGPGSTHHYFAPLEQLADERAVVVYDQLGCGSSDRPSDVEWSLDLFRDEVAAVRCVKSSSRTAPTRPCSRRRSAISMSSVRFSRSSILLRANA